MTFTSIIRMLPVLDRLNPEHHLSSPLPSFPQQITYHDIFLLHNSFSPQRFRLFSQLQFGSSVPEQGTKKKKKKIYCCILVLARFLFTVTSYKRTERSKHEVKQTGRSLVDWTVVAAVILHHHHHIIRTHVGEIASEQVRDELQVHRVGYKHRGFNSF